MSLATCAYQYVLNKDVVMAKKHNARKSTKVYSKSVGGDNRVRHQSDAPSADHARSEIRRTGISFGTAYLVAVIGACGLCPAVCMVAAEVAQAETAAVVAEPVDTEAGNIKEIWNDPTFQKQFVAGYGVNAEIEPRISSEEAVILEKIRPLMADNLSKAKVTLEKLMKPDCTATLDYTLASIAFEQNNMSEAMQHYQRAVEKFPSFRRAWRNIGLIHVRSGQYDESISAFTKMIELGGGDAYSYGLLGFAYSSKQDYQAAEVAYRNALLLQPQNTEWRLGLTRCVFKQSKFEDAATLLSRLIEQYPEKAELWLLQAQCYLGMKMPLKAAENLESLDQLSLARPDTLYMLGNIYTTEDLMDLAVRAYMRAISVDVQQSPAASLRSVEALATRGAVSQAQQLIAYMQKVWGESMDEGDRRRLLKLETRLSMADGLGSDDTAKVLEEILKLDPLDGEALMLLGQHYSMHNQPEKSLFYYERAASIDAFEGNAKIRQAQVLVRMRRYTDAIPLLRRAQEIKPRDDIARYIEQVERAAVAERNAKAPR